MIVLDYQDRRPIYEQVTDKFQILILNGVLLPGSQMPSVRQLATELSVNPNTIQRAYMELEKLGLIYPVKGRGNFVADSSQVQKRTDIGHGMDIDSGCLTVKQKISKKFSKKQKKNQAGSA